MLLLLSPVAARPGHACMSNLVLSWLSLQPLRRWWSEMPQHRQDRLASLIPLVAVILFVVAVVTAITYLRMEERQSQRQSVQHAGEYTRQQIHGRLADRLEQIRGFAQYVMTQPDGATISNEQVSKLLSVAPEIRSMTLVDVKGRVHDNFTAGSPHHSDALPLDTTLPQPAEHALLQQVMRTHLPVYRVIATGSHNDTWLGLMLPLTRGDSVVGALYVRYSLSALAYQAIPSEIFVKYALALLDNEGRVLLGNPDSRQQDRTWLDRHFDWISNSLSPQVYTTPLSRTDNSLVLRVQPYDSGSAMADNALFLMVLGLSLLTGLTLFMNWKYLRGRQRSQRALETETNFRRAMENSMLIGMRALDLEGRITYINTAFCSMTGWSEDELIGQLPPYPFWHPEDYARHEKTLQETMQDNIPRGGYEMRVLRKNGSTFEARMYMSPLVGLDGIQTGWMTSMTDITESNRFKRQLTAAYERFTRVLDALEVTVSVAPLGGHELLFANRAYRQVFGEDQGTSAHLQLLTLAGKPVTQAPQDGALQHEPSNNTEVFVPGLNRWFEVRTRYLEWVDGRLAQLVTANDITARRQAEDTSAQHEARAQAAARLVTMGEMASSVAHELNQPLTAINNYCNGIVSRLERGQMDEDSLKIAIRKTAQQATRAGQVIQRIRNFVKRSMPNYSPTRVEEIVTDAVELVDIEMRRRQVRLAQQMAPDLPELVMDRILIEQVLINLLKNAAESIDLGQLPPERREVWLQVQRAVREGRPVVEFVIEDKGTGMSDETLQHVFEAFYSTKAEGMGIGLNLCRSIVESHHGRLHAQNIYNESETEVVGCRFTFWIPVPANPEQ